MCGLYLTTNDNNIEELALANSNRGLIANTNTFEIECRRVTVGHILQPTNPNQYNQHPSIVERSMLWHNGLLKSSWIESIGYSKDDWDTKVLCTLIELNGFDCLNDIDGSFACVYKRDNNLYVFRNDLSPLYYGNSNQSVNISSTKTKTTPNKVKSGVVFMLNIITNELVEHSTFRTINYLF